MGLGFEPLRVYSFSFFVKSDINVIRTFPYNTEIFCRLFYSKKRKTESYDRMKTLNISIACTLSSVGRATDS